LTSENLCCFDGSFGGVIELLEHNGGVIELLEHNGGVIELLEHNGDESPYN